MSKSFLFIIFNNNSPSFNSFIIPGETIFTIEKTPQMQLEEDICNIIKKELHKKLKSNIKSSNIKNMLFIFINDDSISEEIIISKCLELISEHNITTIKDSYIYIKQINSISSISF